MMLALSTRPSSKVALLLTSYLVVSASYSGAETLEQEVRSALDYIVGEHKSHPFLTVYVETADGEVLLDDAVASNQFFPEGEEPTNRDWMRIWSMTKLVTSVLALDAMERGELSLDDPITQFLPELSDLKVAMLENGNPISKAIEGDFGEPAAERSVSDPCDYRLDVPDRVMTVHDLLVHTGGFYYAWTGISCLDEAQAALSLPAATSSAEWLQGVAKLPLVQSPDDGWYYGLNTTVLGFLIERAAGKSLQRLVEERILAPYDIEALSYLVPSDVELQPVISGADGELRLATAKELAIFGGLQPPYGPETTLFLGGEGMVATAPAFARFLRILFFPKSTSTEPLLTPQSLKLLVAPHINETEWGAQGYGVYVSSGLRADQTYDRPGIVRGGGYEGTMYWVDQEKERVGVVMTQVFMPPFAGVSIDDRVRALLDHYID